MPKKSTKILGLKALITKQYCIKVQEYFYEKNPRSKSLITLYLLSYFLFIYVLILSRGLVFAF